MFKVYHLLVREWTDNTYFEKIWTLAVTAIICILYFQLVSYIRRAGKGVILSMNFKYSIMFKWKCTRALNCANTTH